MAPAYSTRAKENSQLSFCEPSNKRMESLIIFCLSARCGVNLRHHCSLQRHQIDAHTECMRKTHSDAISSIREWRECSREEMATARWRRGDEVEKTTGKTARAKAHLCACPYDRRGWRGPGCIQSFDVVRSPTYKLPSNNQPPLIMRLGIFFSAMSLLPGLAHLANDSDFPPNPESGGQLQCYPNPGPGGVPPELAGMLTGMVQQISSMLPPPLAEIDACLRVFRLEMRDPGCPTPDAPRPYQDSVCIKGAPSQGTQQGSSSAPPPPSPSPSMLESGSQQRESIPVVKEKIAAMRTTITEAQREVKALQKQLRKMKKEQRKAAKKSKKD